MLHQPHRLFPLLAAAVLAGCSSAEDAPAAAASAAAAQIPAAAGAPAEAPGEWQVNEDASGVKASFVGTDGKSLLAMNCDMATTAVTLAIANPTPGNTAFVLQAGGTAARLDTVADGNTADPHQVAAIERQAPVFVGFIQPGGTITVTQPGGPSITVPSTSGLGRVLEGCQ
ncbi:hypothetical protein [Alteraurantiacibacter buctensis]|uniref:Uncharacterized protein n=1 Tax=Alteraurantiacibacter buctensis TaxID=1503981 RepID=A0A844YWK5_9SPHN|nr:hypothetical protein [Alteraurantiacibacter buctensis]MXO71370.1 hypothetical protein [Alteraurantiacibacter buctensis]